MPARRRGTDPPLSVSLALKSTQVRATAAVVRWFFRTRFRTSDELGTPAMFADVARLGAMAVSLDGFAKGNDEALFRILVAAATFQAQRDERVFQILRTIPAPVARDLGNPAVLLARAHTSGCAHLATVEALHAACDVAKPLPHTLRCRTHPTLDCPVKEHGLHLRRYADFGKLPTSAALVIQDAAGGGLSALYERVLQEHRLRRDRAHALEASLLPIWRASFKVVNLFLANVSNPDLSRAPPWERGVDWTQFVVIDRHVESFLESLELDLGRGYEGRRAAVQRLAQAIDLRKLDRRVRSYNPQLVAAAIYHFMSASNRRAAASDCCQLGRSACEECPSSLATSCPVSALLRVDTPDASVCI